VATLDLAFPDVLLAIEIDGWAWHGDPERFQRDRRRQNVLVTAGWTVLRFTWADLIERPEHVLATIVHALARLAAAPKPNR
jgi:very-short-patch-repair endonuclease